MHAGGPTGGFGGAPRRATKRCTGWVKMPNWVCGTHANGPTGHEALYWVWRTHVSTPTGALGGAPYGATKRCTGCGGRMWPPPLGPSVLRWSSLCGHETLYWVWRTLVAPPTRAL
eukprot:1722527-Pyramimonas_sp.AAC.1